MGLTRDFAPETSLEELVKKRLSPRLFGKTLVDTCSYEGIFTHLVRSWLKIDVVEGKWPILFQEAMSQISEEEIDKKAIHSPHIKHEILHLKHAYWDPKSPQVQEYQTGLVQLDALIRKEESLRPKSQKFHWTQDSEQLRNLSLFTSVSKTPVPEINEELYNSIRQDQISSNPSITSLISYIRHYFTTSGPLPAKTQQVLVSCQRGISIENELKEIIAKGKKSKNEEESAIKDLKSLSQKTATSLAQMDRGERTTLFGGCQPRKANLNFNAIPLDLFSDPNFVKIRNFLHDKKSATFIAQKIVKALQNDDITNKFSNDKIFSFVKKGLIEALRPQFKESYWKENQSLWEKLKLAPLELGRRGIHHIAEYGNKKIASLILGSLPRSLSDDIKEILTVENVNKAEEKIAEKIHIHLTNLLEASHDVITNNIGSLTANLPGSVKSLIRLAGLGDPGEADSNQIWFEVTKIGDNNFTLSVFSTGQGVLFHPSIEDGEGKKYLVPVVYEGLTEEQLDSEFIFRLLSFQANELLGKETYSFGDIYESLLQGFEPKEQQNNPETYFHREKLTQGSWGVLKSYLKTHLSLYSEENEDRFFFNLQKQALLDIWTHVKDNPEILEEQVSLRSSIKAGAEALALKAIQLYEKKILTLDELKVIYATTSEAIELTKEKEKIFEEKQTAQLIPTEIKNKLYALLSGFAPDSIYLEIIKEQIVGVLGNQVEAVFDQIAKELSIEESLKKRIEKKNRSQRSWNVLKMDASTLFQTAYRVGYVALAVFSASKSTKGLTIFIAQHIFRTWCFPVIKRPLMRLGQRYLAQALTKLFLTPQKVDLFNQLIYEWESYLLRTGEINYTLPEGLSSNQEISLKWSAPEVTLEAPPVADKVQSTLKLDPTLLELTSENFIDRLQELINKSELPTNQSHQNIYLTEQIKNLPVPTLGGDDAWDQIKEYRLCLELISLLTFKYFKSFNKKESSIEHHNQYLVNLYKLYAISDKLARRCPDSKLEGFNVNPWGLAFWPKNVANRLIDLKSQEQLAQVCHYFRIDPKKEYTDNDIRQLGRDSLFYLPRKEWMREKVITSDHCGSEAETRYYKNLLKDPNIQLKLKILGYDPENSLMVDLLTELALDRPFDKFRLEEALKQPLSKEEFSKYQSIFSEKGINPRQSILPRPFYLLRLTNYLINASLNNTTEVVDDCTSMNDFQINIVRKGDALLDTQRHLSKMPFVGRFFNTKQSESSGLRRLGGNTRVNSLRNTSYTSREFHIEKETNVIEREKEISRSILHQKVFISSIHRSTRRNQNEIANLPPTFDESEAPSSFKNIVSSISNSISNSLGLSKINKKLSSNALASAPLTPEDRRILEMIWSKKSEQVSRAISYFSQRMDILDEEYYFHILDILLLDSNLLYEQLRIHPEFIQTLGEFFTRGLKIYGLENHPNVALQFIRLGIFVKMECDFLKLDSSQHFPNFRELLLNGSWPSDSEIKARRKEFLMLPYHTMDPSKASPQTLEQAAEDLCWNGLTCIYPVTPFTHICQETIIRWEYYISKTLDQPENSHLRNKILTDILIKNESIPKKTDVLEWCGSFPNYSNGRFSICLNRIIDHIRTNDQDHQKVINSKLESIFGNGDYNIKNFQGRYHVSFLDVTAEVISTPKQKDRILFFKHISGKKYTLVQKNDSQNQTSPYTSYWLGEPDTHGKVELLTYEYNNLKKTDILQSGFPIDDLWNTQNFRVPISSHIQEDTLLDEVEFSKQSHGLHLLSWFQPLSTIKCFQDPTKRFHIKRIEFQTIGLSFQTTRINNQWEAVSEEQIPGFYIARKQKCESLSKYSRYLLLENSRKEKRVIITQDSLNSSLLSGALKRFELFTPSHFMEMMVESLAQKNQLNKEKSEQYFVYEVDSKGRLISPDPNAILHLLIHHAASNNIKEVLFYLNHFESIGRRTALPDSVKAMINLIKIGAAVSKNEIMIRIVLRLTAICHENELLHANKEKGSDANKSESNKTLLLISLIANLTNLSHFLEKRNHLPHLAINEYQELFILNNIVKAGQELTGRLMPEPPTVIKTLIDYIGPDVLPSILVQMPDLSKRYDFLRRKYQLPGEQGVSLTRAFLENFILGSDGTVQENSDKTKKGNNTLNELIEEWFNSKDSNKKKSSSFTETACILHEKICILTNADSLPIKFSEICTEDLYKYFPHYYRLAIGDLPEDCKKDELKKADFIKRSSDFKRALSYMKGTKESILDQNIIHVLHSASLKPYLFPSAKEISLFFQDYKAKLNLISDLRSNKNVSAEALLKAIDDKDSLLSKFCKRINASCELNFFEFKSPILNALVKDKVLSLLKGGTKSYLCSKLGIGPFNTIYQTAKLANTAVHAAVDAHIESIKAVKQKGILNTQKAEDKPLDPQLQKALQDEDNHFSAIFDRFFHDNFTRDDAVPIKRTNPIRKFRSPINKRLYKKSFRKMQNSLKDFYNRSKNDSESWKFKSFENLFVLESQLTKAKTELTVHLKSEKRAIFDFLKRERRDQLPEDQILIDAIQKQVKEPQKISEKEEFKRLIAAFLYGDHQRILSMSSISQEDIPQLESMLYRYLLKATRKQQMERCLTVVNKLQSIPSDRKQEIQVRLEELAFELRRPRAYRFDGTLESTKLKVPQSSRLLKAFLLFEYKKKKMLWQKQVKQLERMLLGPQAKTVLEQIVGSGKTFLIPLVDFFAANGLQMVINVWPTPLAPTNSVQNSTNSHKYSGQDSIVMKITRSLKLGVENLWAYLRMFQRSIEKREQVNTTKEDLQSLELKFIEGVRNRIKGKPSSPSDEELFDYMNLLQIIRKTGKGNLDEAHEAFKRNNELNYPLGMKKHLNRSYVATIKECIRVLKEHIDVKNNKQTFVKTENYLTEMLPLIASGVSKYKLFGLSDNEQEIFAQYVSGALDHIPEFILKHPMKKEMGLMKGMLTKILPKTCLENRKVNVSYGPSQKGNGEYARPCGGNEDPIETATIQNPFEAVAKSYLMFLHRRLTDEQGITFLKTMNDLALLEVSRSGVNKENTLIANLFKLWCADAGHENFTLDNFTKEKIEANPKNPNIQTVLKILSENDEAVLAYVEIVVAPTIEYFDQNLKSDSQNFGSMFASYYSCTGTPNKDGVFPQGNKVLWDKGTAGETIDLLCKMCNSPDSIIEIDGDKPSDSLEDVIQNLEKNRKISAIIDQGAIFNGLKNETVTQRLLKYIETSRPDMDGIVFYDSNKKLMIWERNATKPILLEVSTIPPERRLSYYDNTHTFGAHIDQSFGSIGLVMIGEDVETLSYIQAVGRMRGLKTANQKVCIGMTKKVSEMIAGPGKKPTIRQTIEFARVNEARTTAEDNYLSDCQKIANVIRRAVLDKMIFADSIGEMISVAIEFSSVLITENNFDPFALYGNPEESVDPLDALKKLKDNHYNIIKDSSKFTEKEKKKIRKELKAIVQDVYPEKVTVHKTDNKAMVIPRMDLGLMQQAEQDQTQENDQDIERDNDLQQEQDQQLENQVSSQSLFSAPLFRKNGASWDPTIDYFSSKSWLSPADLKHTYKHDTVSLFRLLDLMKTASCETIANASDAFHGRLLCSNNFAGILKDGSLATFSGPRQKMVREILVIESFDSKGNKHIHTCALDEEDVTFWRDKFEQDRKNNKEINPKIRIVLFDVHGNGTIDSGKHGLTNNELCQNQVFNRHVALWKIFNGNCNYTAKELKLLDKWMELKGRKTIRDAFYAIHKQRTLQPLRGSNVESLFLDVSEILRHIDVHKPKKKDISNISVWQKEKALHYQRMLIETP